MKTTSQKDNFIARGRNLAKSLVEFAAFDAEYVATDAANVIVDADFTGVNEGLSTADMVGFQTIVKAINAEIASVSGRNTIIENYKNV